MSGKTVRVQALVGELVYDVNGARVGRIRSIQAESEGEDCVVREYHLGGAALLYRLGLSALRLVGWHGHGKPLCVPWDQLDISDPERPRLRCTKEELERMGRDGAHSALNS
jgi:sporulation protein YlmC with PRC-barrel domain